MVYRLDKETVEDVTKEDLKRKGKEYIKELKRRIEARDYPKGKRVA